jgi:hypothetical protein
MLPPIYTIAFAFAPISQTRPENLTLSRPRSQECSVRDDANAVATSASRDRDYLVESIS